MGQNHPLSSVKNNLLLFDVVRKQLQNLQQDSTAQDYEKQNADIEVHHEQKVKPVDSETAQPITQTHRESRKEMGQDQTFNKRIM